MSNIKHQTDEQVEILNDQDIEFPKNFKVILHNDDYTTMEFVISVLKGVFGKSESESMDIMLKVHQEGVGICGIYTYEIATTKQEKVRKLSKENGFPLKCTIEEE